MSTISVLMTRENFAAALAAAKPGTDITYHVGNLMSDREYGQNFLTVHSVARAAWAAMEAGKVALLQRRVDSTRVQYLARVLPSPHRSVMWTGSYNPTRFEFNQRRAA